MPSESTPSVLILMATYQGERFMEEQLDSFGAQVHQAWELLIADDGSNDQTCTLIAKTMKKASLCRYPWALIDGPRKGAAANFLYLLSQAHKRIADGRSMASFIALADQDDVWLPSKLSAALTALQAVPDGQAALWCSAVKYWGNNSRKQNNQRSLSPQRPLSFSNALVQNMVRGNTILLNRSALDVLVSTESELPVVMHDWWLYLLMSACGARLLYCDEPTVLSRQHSSNAVGAAASWPDRIKRFRFMLQGGFARWNRCHMTRLNRLARDHPSRLEPQALEKIAQFDCMIHATNSLERLRLLQKGGFYRQTAAENLSLRMALALGRF